MLYRFCLYGFLKNQRYFEPFLMLVFLQQGLSYFLIGLLVASQNLTVNLLEIPSGVLADTWGRRACLVLSFLAYIGSFILFAIAGSAVWYFPAMILFGVGESGRTGSHKAMIFEWLRLQGRESERTRVYGLTRSWSKIGSAISSVLAAVFVFATGDYRSIFLLAIVPYLINVGNVLGYPRELDGEHAKAASLKETVAHFRSAVQVVRKQHSMRALLTESMAWDGLFHSIKDYLQPVLALLVATKILGAVDWQEWGFDSSEQKLTALLVGGVYTLLFLLSAFASRSSHRVVQACGEDRTAMKRLWLVQFFTCAIFIVADCYDWLGLIAVLFIVMNITQNLWRPILIGQYDRLAAPELGATIMSIESQARRLATLVLAPTIGLAIDWVTASQLPGTYWPIGVCGMLCAGFVLRRQPAEAAS